MSAWDELFEQVERLTVGETRRVASDCRWLLKLGGTMIGRRDFEVKAIEDFGPDRARLLFAVQMFTEMPDLEDAENPTAAEERADDEWREREGGFYLDPSELSAHPAFSHATKGIFVRSNDRSIRVGDYIRLEASVVSESPMTATMRDVVIE